MAFLMVKLWGGHHLNNVELKFCFKINTSGLKFIQFTKIGYQHIELSSFVKLSLLYHYCNHNCSFWGGESQVYEKI